MTLRIYGFTDWPLVLPCETNKCIDYLDHIAYQHRLQCALSQSVQ
jgi:hypothetical protein